MMMNRLLYLFIASLLMSTTLSCASTAKLRKSITAANKAAVMQQLGLDGVTEVQFTKKEIDGCMSAAARMYTDYGIWHDVVKVEGYIPVFIWEGMKLILSSDRLFTVYTSGIETVDEYHSSIVIVDENGVDALAPKSPFRQLLIGLFENRMKGLKNNEFYRAFWKFHDPERYRELYHPKEDRDYVLYY